MRCTQSNYSSASMRLKLIALCKELPPGVTINFNLADHVGSLNEEGIDEDSFHLVITKPVQGYNYSLGFSYVNEV